LDGADVAGGAAVITGSELISWPKPGAVGVMAVVTCGFDTSGIMVGKITAGTSGWFVVPAAGFILVW